jgi:uncharacterized membrane-anchored protein
MPTAQKRDASAEDAGGAFCKEATLLMRLSMPAMDTCAGASRRLASTSRYCSSTWPLSCATVKHLSQEKALHKTTGKSDMWMAFSLQQQACVETEDIFAVAKRYHLACAAS